MPMQPYHRPEVHDYWFNDTSFLQRGQKMLHGASSNKPTDMFYLFYGQDAGYLSCRVYHSRATIDSSTRKSLIDMPCECGRFV